VFLIKQSTLLKKANTRRLPLKGKYTCWLGCMQIIRDRLE
jgi:hypothetical protein